MPSQPTAFQTFYRLTVMVGTLACGSMAYFLFGPEPGRLAEMIDQAASLVMEVPPHDMADSAPLEFAPAAETAALSAAPAPRYDAAVQPASALVAIDEAAPPRDLERLERERLTAPLLAVGATRADVTSWGHGSATVYRATASVAVGDPAVGLERRFDAVDPTPEGAVDQLIDQVRSAPQR